MGLSLVGLRIRVVLISEGGRLVSESLWGIWGLFLRDFWGASISVVLFLMLTHVVRVESLLHFSHPLTEAVYGEVECVARFLSSPIGGFNFPSCPTEVAIGLVDGFEALIDRGG